MSSGSNGSNGRESSGSGSDGFDPFSQGVWMLTRDAGEDMLVRVSLPNGDVDPDVTEDGLRKEMAEFGCVNVILRPRYVLTQVRFPLTARNAAGQATGGYRPAFLASSGKHETFLEFLHEFPVFASLRWITFLSDVHPEDLRALRGSVLNAEEGAEQTRRLQKSGLVTPDSAGVR